MADALKTLARLRKLEADLAKRDLAHALRAEMDADAAVDAARQAKLAEANAAVADATLAAAFAAWLPAGAAAIARCGADAQAAAAACQSARAALGERKGALEAVGVLQDARTAAARKASLRRGQMQLDEMARRVQPKVVA